MFTTRRFKHGCTCFACCPMPLPNGAQPIPRACAPPDMAMHTALTNATAKRGPMKRLAGPRRQNPWARGP
eukprot:957013-Lingulodinium_polyedra.AAC.1